MTSTKLTPPTMSLDFSRQSLVGRSFRGQNLTGANFTAADIRSADFSQAILTGATFHQARGGLSKPRLLLQSLSLLVCSATIGTMSVVAGTFSGTFLIQENIDKFTVVPGLLCLLCFVSISLPLVRQGFTPRGFQTVLVTGTLSIVGITFGTLQGTALSTVDSAGGLTGALVLLIANAVTLTIAGLTGGPLLVGLCLLFSVAIALLSYPAIYPVAISGITDLEPGAFNTVGMTAIIVMVLLSGSYIALRVLARDRKFDLIQKVATTFTALGGTNFHRADLTNTIFDHANLKCTNLSHGKLIGTGFYHSKHLQTAQLAGTILSHPLVRRLALFREGQQQDFSGLDLKGINLTQADLCGANFTDSNLAQANLTQANFVDANLRNLQAIGAQFESVQLTGACLDGWNIDSTTALENVVCDYIYLRQNQQERRPSSGTFKPGEFTKLFQEIIDTVDLIFQGGIDWQALHTMLAEASAQQAPGEPPLSLRSIENKNDGVVVVRVDAPPEADKADLHQQLTQHYEKALHRLEGQYQKQLQAKEEQIAMYREHQANLNAIAQSLASRPVTLPPQVANNRTIKETATKLVTLKINASAQDDGLSATLHIGHEGKLPFLECTGSLPSSAQVFTHYQQWKDSYRQYLSAGSASSRISSPPAQVTNVSIGQLQQRLKQRSAQLRNSFNQWLTASEFGPVKETLLEHLSAHDSIRFVLSANDAQLWQLPWQSWNLLERYPHAALTLSPYAYQQNHSQMPARLMTPAVCSDAAPTAAAQTAAIKILAVVGNSDGLDTHTDCQLLEQLSHTQVTILTEPSRQTLNDCLWSQPWDILFFAGHSNSHQGEGYLQLNATDSLSLPDIRFALKKACQRGLQLAIFNSCDGIGLAQHLSDLALPQMIVMREPVCDAIAQTFLKNLLTAFTSGQPLPQAVRAAQEQLQGLEDRFLCATWLPILCQPATTAPLTWQQLNSAVSSQ
ncbi:MAG: pentapeptide repeat-containing protein [Cyanobacteria bacterium J06607_10]